MRQRAIYQPGRRGLFALIFIILSLLLLQGCATLRPRNPLPEDLESKVQVPGMPAVRAWGDEVSEVFTEFALESVKQEKAALGKDFVKKPASFLALSGGGR